MNTTRKISFVLPIYNESENIREFYSKLLETTKVLETEFQFELLFINDGSTDNSLELLVELQKNDDQIRIIDFSRNFGHQAAITAGLDSASGEAAIIMDTDLQDPPDVCLQLIEQWKEGFEVVYAKRSKRKDGFFKKTTASLFYRLLNKLTDFEIPLDTGDFRLLDRRAVNELNKFREQNRYVRGLVSFIGFKQTAVFFERDERFAGTTNYPLSKMIKLSLDGITGFSAVPIKMIGQLGILVSLISFIGIAYVLAQKLFYPEITVSGWTAIMLSVLFMGGIQIMMLGILGSYIGRIYSEVQNRPLYIISSILESSKN